MIKLTRAQLVALKNKWTQGRLKQTRCTLHDKNYTVYEEIHYRDYRSFRRHVQGTYGCDGAVTVQWCNMWLCIEKDGYTHS